MTVTQYQFWPFSTAADGFLPPAPEPIAFLQTAHAQGFESFRCGVNDFGARSPSREGCILERGRTRWEIRLACGEERRLIAYVNDFATAGEAVQQWLAGKSPQEIVAAIASRLITPPGATASHVILDEHCPS